MALFKKKSLRKTLTPYCTAIIAAAGSSSRMGGEDKLFADLSGSPVILHTLRAFQASEYIDEIIVVTREAVKERGLHPFQIPRGRKQFRKLHIFLQM